MPYGPHSEGAVGGFRRRNPHRCQRRPTDGGLEGSDINASRKDGMINAKKYQSGREISLIKLPVLQSLKWPVCALTIIFRQTRIYV